MGDHRLYFNNWGDNLLSHPYDDLVTDLMAKAVVQKLERVKVQHDECGAGTTRRGNPHGMLQPDHKARPVPNAGHLVAPQFLLELCFALGPSRHVVSGDNDAATRRQVHQPLSHQVHMARRRPFNEYRTLCPDGLAAGIGGGVVQERGNGGGAVRVDQVWQPTIARAEEPPGGS